MLRSASRETKTAESGAKRVPAERESELHAFHAANGHGARGSVNAPYLPAPYPLAAMHRAFGNQVVLRSLSPRRPTIQTKLTISTPGDQYEQEADGLAELVMRMPDPSATSSAMAMAAPILQPKCACTGSGGDSGTCSECAKKEELQRSANGPAALPEVPPIVHDVLGQPGRPLDAITRAFFEPRFGQDLSTVRMHTDSHAAKSAHSVNALAYTVGNHVVFGAGQYTQSTREGGRLVAHELAHVLQQRGGIGRRIQRQMVLRPSGNTVGGPAGRNLREDVLSVMDRVHWVEALAGADYALERARVVPQAGGATIATIDFPETIKAITRNEISELPPRVADRIVSVRLGGIVGFGMANAPADVMIVQIRLRALGLLSDADYAAEMGVVGSKTAVAIKELRIRYVSGSLGWQPIRVGDVTRPDESQFGGDRFGGQTFEFNTALPSWDPDADPPGSSVSRNMPISVFVPTMVTAPPSGGKPAATSSNVAIFFSPGDVTGSSASNAVLYHGLRGGAEGTDYVLISVMGIHSNSKKQDGWVAITNAAITFCLDRAGLPATLGTVRLISHSRGAEGLKRTLTAKTLTATVDKIIVLDESTTFGPGGRKPGDLGPLIKAAAPTKPGNAGITMMPTGGSVSYQVIAMPLGATTKVPPIDPACARAIGYSRLILDAINDRADVATDLFGPAPAMPSLSVPDWSAIKAQLLPGLPARGQFSTKSATPIGMKDIYGFCGANSVSISKMDANVMAAWAEQNKSTPKVTILQTSPKFFCQKHGLGIINFTPDIDAHHNFVSEIAHELFR